MERFISEECYNEIMGMAAEIVAEAVLDRIGEGVKDEGVENYKTRVSREVGNAWNNAGNKIKTLEKRQKKLLKKKDFEGAGDNEEALRKAYNREEALRQQVQKIPNRIIDKLNKESGYNSNYDQP